HIVCRVKMLQPLIIRDSNLSSYPPILRPDAGDTKLFPFGDGLLRDSERRHHQHVFVRLSDNVFCHGQLYGGLPKATARKDSPTPLEARPLCKRLLKWKKRIRHPYRRKSVVLSKLALALHEGRIRRLNRAC